MSNRARQHGADAVCGNQYDPFHWQMEYDLMIFVLHVDTYFFQLSEMIWCCFAPTLPYLKHLLSVVWPREHQIVPCNRPKLMPMIMWIVPQAATTVFVGVVIISGRHADSSVRSASILVTTDLPTVRLPKRWNCVHSVHFSTSSRLKWWF